LNVTEVPALPVEKERADQLNGLMNVTQDDVWLLQLNQ